MPSEASLKKELVHWYKLVIFLEWDRKDGTEFVERAKKLGTFGGKIRKVK